MAETHKLPGLDCWISLALFTDVSNAGKLIGKATSGTIKGALFDPTLIAGQFHVLAAANKAIMNEVNGQMKTRTIYSEIIFSVSPSMNISDSFKNFGIKDSSENVLVLWIASSAHCQPQVEQFEEEIKGKLTSLSDLAKLCNQDKIKKFYKIPYEENTISTLENSVVTRLAVKDIT